MTNLQAKTQTSPAQAPIDMPKRGMPVTIITGFLGSGKTTLLNHILENQKDLKVAVLVNEFGDINIDSQLLVSVDENMMELTNGCICCTINDGLIDAVYGVLERSDQIDYMVVETTGVADPLPIALTFLGTELQHLTRLDSILTVIDAESFSPEHYDSDAAFKQIMYGDIIVLNKTDLVGEAELKDIENYIEELKPKSRVLRSQRGAVPLPLVLDVDVNDADFIQQASGEDEHSHSDHDHHHENHEHSHDHHEHETHHHHEDHDHAHDHHHEHHHHHSDHLANDGFVAISFQRDRAFDIDKFQNFLDKQLPVDVFRAKGVLWFSGMDNRYVFQLSGKRYELKNDHRELPPFNQLVLIGRNLDQAEIEQNLEACLV
ncbi:cobalamin synthesis protein P47K [Thalassoporum mexicanum PCC 7367]|uniref:CobW family GTP-binding protein n=1 Tax=Thalassoporum mexicanum TaxID=3457544 RepID=UPI00029FE000|nr:GTP-binding protein [Pseudanabaena sp. PCC 7367]AFY68336.1 cobalamin synthesis protein P47K [Pseudanabaena sp. PCC 7367]